MAKATAKKKKSKWRFVPFIIAGLLCIYIASVYFLQQYAENRAKFSMYPGFGIELGRASCRERVYICVFEESV